MPFLLLMPSFNQARYIVEAVRSVLSQDDPDWELWIVDNSTDNTPEVMQQFADTRIRFHHFPERMDPGTCLNWMLEQASGRYFSYVHTDNNLHPSYVRRMRDALSANSLTLAYCDMRTVNSQGRPLNIFRRGSFDLARLLSTDTLGVPFAATVELARRIGGFKVADFADDVNFCVSAYGIAQYEYIPDVLLDYRLHHQSRTEAAGGASELNRMFIQLMVRLAPALEQRGCAPFDKLRTAIVNQLNNMDYLIEDLWYRKVSKYCQPWWSGAPKLGYFFFAGLTDGLSFDELSGRPPRKWLDHIDASTDRFIAPWTRARVINALHRRRHEMKRFTSKINQMLPTWALGQLGLNAATQRDFRVQSVDFRTLWIARQLEIILGWKPHLDASISMQPSWLRWPTAHGGEPLLDCRTSLRLDQ